jgi:hypothetical protein
MDACCLSRAGEAAWIESLPAAEHKRLKHRHQG